MSVFSKNLQQKTGDGVLFLISQEKLLGKQIVVTPDKTENSNGCEGGLGQRHDDLEKDLDGRAAFHIGRLLQVNGKSLNISCEDHNRKSHIARDLRQGTGKKGKPEILGIDDPPGKFHPVDRNDGGENREHHGRNDQVIQKLSAPEAVTHQRVGSHSRKKDHESRRAAGDDQAVPVSAENVQLLKRIAVVIRGKKVSHRQGKGIAHDLLFILEGI